jgi:hypothetical protein
MGPVFVWAMAGAASAHQAATASREETSQQRADSTRRTSADPQRAQQGSTAAPAAAPAALDSLSRLQQLADASPRVAQLRRLQALADSRFAPVAQLAGGPEEEELVQGKFASAELQPQLQQAPRVNNTGLPDQLKSGIESLSGLSMDHVRVHYNSAQPEQLNALAYAQGSDIHLAPGQERHLPHEAWHVVQQAQGRVQPTKQMARSISVNNDAGLEHEADVMGTRALQCRQADHHTPKNVGTTSGTTVQRQVGFEFEMGDIQTQHRGLFSGWHQHAKGAVMSSLAGYRLTADEGAGNSQLEVIIPPIDETNPAAVHHLVNVIGPAVVQSIDNIAQAANQAWTSADQIAGIHGSSWDRYFSDSPTAAGIRGQLQMTGGLAMNKLHDHVSGAQGINYLATLNPMVNVDDATAHGTLNTYAAPSPIAAATLVSVNGIPALADPALTQAQRNQVAAIAAMMATIPINMRTGGAIPYPKAAAGPFLARTDFSRIMQALSPAVKNVLTAAHMRQIVLAAINGVGLPLVAPVVGGDAVIPLGAPMPAAIPALNGLTIDAWVGGVVPTPGRFWGYWQGRDQLTKANFPGNRNQRNSLESMGGYGNRTDPGNRPIVEFRTLGGVFVTDLPGQLERLVGYLNHP